MGTRPTSAAAANTIPGGLAQYLIPAASPCVYTLESP